MRPRVMTMLALILLIVPIAAFAQSQPGSSAYVVVMTGTKEYHTPACPLIQNKKDVSVMTRAQAHGKGFTPHKDCASVPPNGVTAKDGGPVFVYTSKPDATRYHKADCKELPKDAKKVLLDKDAVRGRWPCTICRPPVMKSAGKAVP